MIRGNDRQQIFEDREDYDQFLNILRDYPKICEFRLFAYCLMGNHVHLLLEVPDDNLAVILKRIGSKYVYYFNVKYERVGHLFQDRFKSETVEDDAYFLTVLRYIHRNPVKARLCERVEDYEYSSIHEYISAHRWVDIEYALRMIEKELFLEFNNTPNEDTCMDSAPITRRAVTDTQAQSIIEQVSHCSSVSEFRELERSKRDAFVRQICEKGVSIRQLSRLTGISKGIIERSAKL